MSASPKAGMVHCIDCGVSAGVRNVAADLTTDLMARADQLRQLFRHEIRRPFYCAEHGHLSTRGVKGLPKLCPVCALVQANERRTG